MNEVVIDGVRYVPASSAATADSTPYADLTLLKAAVEQQYTLGLAYPAMKVDVAVAKDGRRDFVTAEVLERTAWRWMKDQRDIGLFHEEGTSGHAEVVESYIYRGPDWVCAQPGNKQVVIKSGDWMLGTVWDDYGWNLVKKGLVRGWSPEGQARRRAASTQSLAKLRS